MSLTVNGSSAASYSPIPEGTYLAVCNMLVDLGMQVNKTYNNQSRKVLVGWEIPEETIDIDGQPHSRTIRKQYTASLNEKANLRKDLAAWRGRDFKQEELAAFDLRNIVGTSCMVNIIHTENNGRTYANISAIMALPRGMQKGRLSEQALVFDLDTATLDDVDDLPTWLGDIIKKSTTYQEMLASDNEMLADDNVQPPVFEELPDDEGDLPF